MRKLKCCDTSDLKLAGALGVAEAKRLFAIFARAEQKMAPESKIKLNDRAISGMVPTKKGSESFYFSGDFFYLYCVFVSHRQMVPIGHQGEVKIISRVEKNGAV